jgi:class 3 adenylate cyclase/alpha-beta hydrolase superfamily lysophospholipase
MEKEIRFCTASDGVRIAYATYGAGYPLILVPGWVSHLDIDAFLWDRVVEGLLAATGNMIMVARFDKRGTGLSQRGDVDLSVDARTRDIDAVANALGLERFALDGISEGGPIALAYAARNPERVSHLLVYGSFARQLFGDEETELVLKMIASEWGLATSMFTTRLLAGASAEDVRKFAHLQVEGATQEDALALIRTNRDIDIRDLLPKIVAPTLIIHGRNDDAVPFERGRELAQSIPNARFFAHDYGHYVGGEAAVSVYRAIGEFLSDVATPGSAAQPPVAPATAGTAVILFTDIAESTSLTERMGDTGFRSASRALDAALRNAVQEAGGVAIDGKLLGDGVLATFPSAAQAIDAARRFHELSSASELRLHLGIHAGDVIREEGNLYGGAVNIASRICELSGPGEILVSDVVRGMARTSAGVEFEDRGEQEMKGIGEPVRLYEVRWRE